MPPFVRKVMTLSVALSLVPTLFVLHYIFAPVDGWTDRAHYILARDFSNFWMAGRLACEGNVGIIYDLQAYHALYRETLAPQSPFTNFSYLPNALPLLLPLCPLPYGPALALWTIGGIVAYSFAVTGVAVPQDRERLLLLGLALAMPAALLTLVDGQASFLLAALLIGGFRMSGSRPIAAGILFGLLTIKPQLGLLIPVVLIMRRQWLTFASASATATLLIGASLALFGLEPWKAYVAETLPYQHAVMTKPMGLAWAIMTTPYAFFVQVGVDIVTAKVMHALVAAAVLVLAIVALARSRSAASDCAIVAFAAVLLSPYSLSYDLVAPNAALLWLLSERRIVESWGSRLVLCGYLALPVLMIPLNLMDLPLLPPFVCGLFILIALKQARGIERLQQSVAQPVTSMDRRQRPYQQVAAP